MNERKKQSVCLCPFWFIIEFNVCASVAYASHLLYFKMNWESIVYAFFILILLSCLLQLPASLSLHFSLSEYDTCLSQLFKNKINEAQNKLHL